MAETITISTTTLLLIIWLVTDPPDVFGLVGVLFWLLMALLKFMFQMLFTTFGAVALMIGFYLYFGQVGLMYFMLPFGIILMIGLVSEAFWPQKESKNDGST